MSVDVNTAEAHRLAADFGVLSASAAAKAAKLVAKAAEDVKQEARRRAPVRSGKMRDSISVSISGLTAEIGPTVYWAPFIEYGTVRQRPQPFMWPAADIAERRMMREAQKIGEISL